LKAIQARSAADLAAAQLIILQNYVANILPELLDAPLLSRLWMQPKLI